MTTKQIIIAIMMIATIAARRKVRQGKAGDLCDLDFKVLGLQDECLGGNVYGPNRCERREEGVDGLRKALEEGVDGLKEKLAAASAGKSNVAAVGGAKRLEGVCVLPQCQENQQCVDKGLGSVCNEKRQCMQCSKDEHCKLSGACNKKSGQCRCATNDHCESGQQCNNEEGTCEEREDLEPEWVENPICRSLVEEQKTLTHKMEASRSIQEENRKLLEQFRVNLENVLATRDQKNIKTCQQAVFRAERSVEMETRRQKDLKNDMGFAVNVLREQVTEHGYDWNAKAVARMVHAKAARFGTLGEHVKQARVETLGEHDKQMKWQTSNLPDFMDNATALKAREATAKPRCPPWEDCQ